jgi:hypothetical protein
VLARVGFAGEDEVSEQGNWAVSGQVNWVAVSENAGRAE